MRRTALISLVGALVASIALVSASGAATTKAQKVTRIDVSTRAAVIHYLHSIHVKAKGAVIQRGFRNYAGARCPGKRWACASTKHTVVQITGHGGKNRFACRSTHCVVVQLSGVSHGVYVIGRQLAAKGGGGGSTGICIKTTGLTQSCSITQSGVGPNVAGVYQNAGKQSGLTQAAAYTAVITQQVTSGNNGNQACVTQNISLDGSTTALRGKPVTVTLDGHQSVTIRQDAAGGGANQASQAATSTGACTSTVTGPATTPGLAQTQVLTSSANGTAAITQNQDTSKILCGDGNATNYSNLCLDVEQNQGSVGSTGTGTNTATWDQENQLVALGNTAAGGSVTQTQGNSDPTVGGLSARVNQFSTGQSTFTSTQNEIQCEDAFKNPPTAPLPAPTDVTLCSTTKDLPSGITVSQQQYGPEGMGYRPTKQNGRIHYSKVTKDPSDSSQLGNPNDSFTITQKSKQNNDTDAVQNNHIIGGASSPGNGTVTQNAIIQNNNKLDLQAGTGTVSGQIDCTGSTKSSCTKTLSVPLITQTPNDPSAYGSGLDFNFQNADPSVTFLCSVDGGTFGSCSNVTNNVSNTTGTQTTSSLPSGHHTFQVETKDADNSNVSTPSASFGWVITPPDPTITSTAPSNPDFSGNTYTFTFTDADSTVHYQCQIDSQTPTSCNSGTSPTYTGLPAGSHTFSVTAYDQSDTYPSDNAATVTWTILPLSLDFLGGDGSAAGWACQAGGPIGLTLGTDTANTFAEIDLTDVAGTSLDTLPQPTFTTDNYAAGSPRYYITLDNGDSLWGYPPNSTLNGTDFAWAINNGNTYQSWSAVVSAESGATVTGASVIADGDQAAGVTDKIGSLTFNGTTFNSGTCS